jgi:hypothetical protein
MNPERLWGGGVVEAVEAVEWVEWWRVVRSPFERGKWSCVRVLRCRREGWWGGCVVVGLWGCAVVPPLREPSNANGAGLGLQLCGAGLAAGVFD